VPNPCRRATGRKDFGASVGTSGGGQGFRRHHGHRDGCLVGALSSPWISTNVSAMFTNTRTQSMRRASVALLAAAGLALGGCAADDDPEAPGEDVTVEDETDLEEEVEDGAEEIEEGVDELEEEVEGEE